MFTNGYNQTLEKNSETVARKPILFSLVIHASYARSSRDPFIDKAECNAIL